MSGLEGTTAEPLASSKRLLEAGRSLSYHENLAAELRFKLFSYMPDLPTLRSLVHTSPILHAHYIYSRDSILRACVDRELDGFIVDAYANLMSRVRELGSPQTDKKITSFLDTYHGWLSGSILCPYDSSVNTGGVRWLAVYHLSLLGLWLACLASGHLRTSESRIHR